MADTNHRPNFFLYNYFFIFISSGKNKHQYIIHLIRSLMSISSFPSCRFFIDINFSSHNLTTTRNCYNNPSPDRLPPPNTGERQHRHTSDVCYFPRFTPHFHPLIRMHPHKGSPHTLAHLYHAPIHPHTTPYHPPTLPLQTPPTPIHTFPRAHITRSHIPIHPDTYIITSILALLTVRGQLVPGIYR